MWAIINNGEMVYQDGPLPKLADMQRAVGGYIECAFRWYMGNGVSASLYCNEEGKLKGLAPNFILPEIRDIIVGPCVLVGEDDTGEVTELSQEELDHFVLIGNVMVVVAGW